MKETAWKIFAANFPQGCYVQGYEKSRYGHSYNGTRIGNRMRYIYWYRFQWPWVMLNLSFKVTNRDSRYASTLNSSKMVESRAKTHYKADWYEVTYHLSNSAIINDLEWLLTEISRIWIQGLQKWYKIEHSYNKQLCDLSNGVISNDLEWPVKVTAFFNVKQVYRRRHESCRAWVHWKVHVGPQ